MKVIAPPVIATSSSSRGRLFAILHFSYSGTMPYGHSHHRLAILPVAVLFSPSPRHSRDRSPFSRSPFPPRVSILSPFLDLPPSVLRSRFALHLPLPLPPLPMHSPPSPHSPLSLSLSLSLALRSLSSLHPFPPGPLSLSLFSLSHSALRPLGAPIHIRCSIFTEHLHF